MTAASTIKTWYLVHKWTSLVCTIFLLIICLTGLPLVFHHEIEHWLDDGKPLSAVPADTPPANLDKLVANARAMYPNEVVDYLSFDPDEPHVFVGMAKTPGDGLASGHAIRMDARTGDVLLDGPLYTEDKFSFMGIMLALHVDLFAGLPGKLFLGFMGLLLLIAIVSGVVLYAPFMRKLDFGTVRRTRQPRLKWLDLHNLLGIVTLVWLLVVGATGVINTWADLVIKYWQHDQLTSILQPYQGQPLVPAAQRAQLQPALEAAQRQVPDSRLFFVAFPGTSYSSPHHYTFFLKGNEPLTSKLLWPVLVDARTAEVTAAPSMPWYVKTLLLSQPLHFGDYGGRPMQILWALLDIASIIVLGSGLYLWLRKRKTAPRNTAPAASTATPDSAESAA